MISIIAAMTHQRVIGHQGRMPWHLPAELAYFKKLTLGKPVIMGRRTFECIGRPLPYRRNIIVSQRINQRLRGCEIYPSLKSALSAVDTDEELMVIGGATLYQQTLPLAQRLHLTFIDGELDGDTFFPEWNPTEWREVSSSSHPADAYNCFAFRSVQLDRIAK